MSVAALVLAEVYVFERKGLDVHVRSVDQAHLYAAL